MSKSRCCYVLCLVLLFIETVAQRNISFDKYSIAEGLPDREITSIVQDQNGFMWVGSTNGISRFDGYDFVNFNSENINGFKDNKVSSLLIVDDTYGLAHDPIYFCLI